MVFDGRRVVLMVWVELEMVEDLVWLVVGGCKRNGAGGKWARYLWRGRGQVDL